MEVVITINIELLHNHAIPFQGKNVSKIILAYKRDTCLPVFSAAPLTIFRTKNHPKCQSTDGVFTDLNIIQIQRKKKS